MGMSSLTNGFEHHNKMKANDSHDDVSGLVSVLFYNNRRPQMLSVTYDFD